jgi:hypothetical protein
VQINGSYDGTTGQTLLSLTQTNVGQGYSISYDSAGIGSSVPAVTVSKAGTALKTAQLQGSLLISRTWNSVLAILGSLSVCLSFDSDAHVTLDGVEYVADEVIFHFEPVGTIDYLSGLTLTATGIDSFSITGLRTQPIVPRLTIAREGDNVILSWNAPGYRLESTDNLGAMPTWTEVGATSSLTLQAGQGRRFYRLVFP